MQQNNATIEGFSIQQNESSVASNQSLFSMSIQSKEFDPFAASQSTINQTNYTAFDPSQRHSAIEETKDMNVSESSIQQSQSELSEVNQKASMSLENITRFYKIRPFPYQVEIFSRIRSEWEDTKPGPKYGNIVYLETGMGKTHIATMLLNYLFDGSTYENNEMLEPNTDEQLQARFRHRDAQLSAADWSSTELMNSSSRNRKKVFFIVPVQNLIEQQAATIERYTNLVVGRYLGRQKRSSKYYSELDAWREEFAKHDVFVAMAKKFYDLLMHGFIKMDEITLVIFDECHHTDQDHLYNLIMRDFFYHKFNPSDPECKRPHILGLTASPIKQKIDRVLAADIESMLQNLANNLYSKFITISAAQIPTIEKNLEIKIIDYESNFDRNIREVEDLEASVIRRLANMVNLPEGSYKLQQSIVSSPQTRGETETNRLMQLLNDSTIEVCHLEQDHTVANFLRGRRNLIELDCTVTKQMLDIAKLPHHDDKVIVILCLIILKKINSLLIELGPLAVKTFLLDLKSDLIAQNGSILGQKRQEAVEIIEKYCRKHLITKNDSFILDSTNDDNISMKLKRLVQILNESYQKDPKLKTIIFVKDRSVAVYLKKMLTGNQPERNFQSDLNEGYLDGKPPNMDYLCEGLLDQAVFKIGFAMGLKRMSLINQAYRSTNIKNTDVFKDVLNKIPSCKSIKISQTEFKETMDNFNQSKINVLIATNVVEEGLDVSTCNLVVCLNELATVKAFIQMKGRARQLNSKFVFLCAQEELQQVKNDQESFARVIELMRHITLRGGQEQQPVSDDQLATTKNELLPLPNIHVLKQQDESGYLEENSTGAKISMRDAKQLVEFFCLAFSDVKIKLHRVLKTEEAPQQQNNLELKPNYVCIETARDGVKFYYAVLYMPMTCINIFRKVNPKSAFIKKKDAENHVALLAIKKLRLRGHLDEYLFPIIQGQSSLSTQMQDSSISNSNRPSKLQLSSDLDLSQPRKKKHITDEQKIQAQELSKKFHQGLKQESRLFDFDNGGSSLVNKLKFTDNLQSLQVLVFHGKQIKDNYPFRTSKDFLGILSDSVDICTPALQFSMHQESKQMEKNLDHLQNLLSNQLMTQTQVWEAEQADEELQVVIDHRSAFGLVDDMKSQGVKSKLQQALMMLQFFHTWVFYYLYSADHKFIKAILKQKFPFVSLFQTEMDKLRCKKSLQVVRNVYGEKTAKLLALNQPQKHQQPHYAYAVPIVQKGHKFQVNWTLVDRALNYIKNRLLELFMPTERHIICSLYNLEEVSKSQHMLRRVWDNKFIGNRHVVIESEQSSKTWDRPIDLSQGKNNEIRQFSQRIRQELQYFQPDQSLANFIASISAGDQDFQIQSFSNQFSRPLLQLKPERKQMLLTTQEYYFIKQGQLQSQRYNHHIIKCRKERHFVDFGKKRRDEQSEYQIMPTVQRKVNTVFDVPEQSLSLAPVSYDQYQMLQQSCYHFLNLNEFMLIDKFIRKFFPTSTCLLEMRDGEMHPSFHSTRLLMTQEQIWEEVKDGGQVVKSRTLEQLKCKLALVREALTAPSACRDYDYERLEFYGDSIIGFLVILELFLVNQSNTEGDLDFRRIERVSNENFYKINKHNKFYKFMITDPHYVFSGFTPAGFSHFEQDSNTNLNYQNKVTQKTYNELNNKLKELKILQERLRAASTQDDDLKQMFCRGELFSLVKIILKDEQMVQKVAYKLTQHHSKIHDREHSKQRACPECKCTRASKAFEKLMFRQDTSSVLKACRILGKAKIAPLRLLRNCTEVVHSKIQAQIQKQRDSRDKKIQENHKIAQQRRRPVYYKQLADVVESVVGAVTIACGVNLTQDFLLELGVLKFDQQKLSSEMDRLVQDALGKEAKLKKNFYLEYDLQQVEQIIGYEFKCKSFLVTALMHKSYIDQSVEQQLQMRLDDYERLEFLGDSILNYMVAKHFFLSSQDDDVRKMPKELHKMKTAVINNALLSLIVIEKGINQFIIYNKKAESFKQQFDKFVDTVHQMVSISSTEQISLRPKEERDAMALDLDELYEHNLKIFGDVFESIIGAVFLDCRDTEKTWEILQNLIMPYIRVYADLDTMQDHSRTKLLELWNQRSYTKRFKCTHESVQVPGRDEITLIALLIGPYGTQKYRYQIFSETFKKDAKNKTRAFYKTLYGIVTKFIEQADKKGQAEEQRLNDHPDQVLEGLRKIINTQRSQEFKLEQERLAQQQRQQW